MSLALVKHCLAGGLNTSENAAKQKKLAHRPPHLHAEIARLRADNARLAMENEFLEKASAFFAIKQAQRNDLN
nr:hypothetical protein [Trueperella pecoris]